MRRGVMLLVALLAAEGMALAAEVRDTSHDRFVACENVASSGFFWVDSTTGQVWWARVGRFDWKYVGRPEGAKAGPIGTYVPRENRSGAGVFILNTKTGEGWWTDGNTWRSLGVPDEKSGTDG